MQVIGWSMKNHPKADLVIDALLMALWRSKPTCKVLIHSDQGVQYTCDDWRTFTKDHNLDICMNRRGNCHEHAACPWGITPSLRVSFRYLKVSGLNLRYTKHVMKREWRNLTTSNCSTIRIDAIAEMMGYRRLSLKNNIIGSWRGV